MSDAPSRQQSSNECCLLAIVEPIGATFEPRQLELLPWEIFLIALSVVRESSFRSLTLLWIFREPRTLVPRRAGLQPAPAAALEMTFTGDFTASVDTLAVG